MKYTLVMLVLLALVSCAEDSSPKDGDLRQLVINAAPNGSSFDFIMPERNDYRGIPQDNNNPLTQSKVELGKMLFHETAFGTLNEFEPTLNTFSCASCHHAQAGFQAGVAQGLGDGGMGFGHAGEGRQAISMDNMSMESIDVQPVRTPSAMNLAYQTNLLWNGQFGATQINEEFAGSYDPDTPPAVNDLGFEGLESQAIAGLTVHRHDFTPESIETNGYKKYFDAAFPNMDNEDKYSNVGAGLAIAAYERTLLSTQAPFQKWLRGDHNAMSPFQKDGAILFFGKAGCVNCHGGPALANMEFHAIGMNDLNEDMAFFFDEEEVQKASLGRASFSKKSEDEYQFKVPQLYNLKDSPFYGHGSSFTDIKDVIWYKNDGMPENDLVPTSAISSNFRPLDLTEEEVDKLAIFIEHALYDPNLDRYVPMDLPSGNCFPNNDDMSKVDLGCN